jgi:hypothetical protein
VTAAKKKTLDQLAAMRDTQNKRIQRIRTLYAVLVRILIDDAARGDVKVRPDTLELELNLGGERRTPAIGIAKILAFDLAALCVAMEDQANLPAFMIHDSPREADLGLSIYHGLFELVRQLHTANSKPIFQYIITTTTPPPEEFRVRPWCVLEVQGAPAIKRLLRVDL